ncbi:MAG: hypothetical protein ACRDUA_21675 [Micromonosporaceae bacterium]
MHSPFTADFRPPIEPPPGIDPEMAATWTSTVERWEPGDDASDRALVSMLARGDQDALPDVIRTRLVEEARKVLAGHVRNDDGVCTPCAARYDGYPIPHPCWGVLLARRVVAAAGTAPEDTVTGFSHPPTTRTRPEDDPRVSTR